ncbi:MAG TPA: SPOR domain-containing protein [Burkholderiales bacterium]|nr:SPOR domain-containing protein [Burkholderiales bacterium]
MRTLFLLLVLANVVFFAWSRYVSPPEAGSDPAPLARQIEPEKLKVIAPGEVPAPTPTPPPPVSARPVPTAVAALKCIEWGSFTLADAPRAEKALEPLALGPRLTQRRTEEQAHWWVFIPPAPSRALAVKKAAELKTLAVNEYFVMQDEGPHRWAISLGVFRTEDGARARLAALHAQGVRSAQIGEREATVPKVWLQVSGVDASLLARLKETARTAEGSELRECAP